MNNYRKSVTYCTVDCHRHLSDCLCYLLRLSWTMFVVCASCVDFETILSPEIDFFPICESLKSKTVSQFRPSEKNKQKLKKLFNSCSFNGRRKLKTLSKCRFVYLSFGEL